MKTYDWNWMRARKLDPSTTITIGIAIATTPPTMTIVIIITSSFNIKATASIVMLIDSCFIKAFENDGNLALSASCKQDY